MATNDEIDEILYKFSNYWGRDGFPKDHVMNPEQACQAILQLKHKWEREARDDFRGIVEMSDTYTFDTGKKFYSQDAVQAKINEIIDYLASLKEQ